MSERVLSLRELNRTSLHRQLLLERQELSVVDAVEQLVGMQSQIPNPPYIGLWTRLKNFTKDDLTQAIEKRQIVRAPLMRSTLHLVTAEMHQKLRPTIQPALEKGYRSFFGKHYKDIDIDLILSEIRPFLETEPRSMGEIRDFLGILLPDVDQAAMSYAVRTYLPVVQVHPSGTWGVGTRATYVPADLWFDEMEPMDVIDFFKLYLVAFGPASLMDFQAFTGMTNLKKTIESAKDEFTLYQDESGTELYDVPDLEIVSADTPVPVTFLPEYENAVISYKDRNRILSDDYRKKVFLSAGRVASNVLIDGFVAATWKTERNKGDAILRISLFNEIKSDVKERILAEGEALLRFIDEDAEAYQIEFE